MTGAAAGSEARFAGLDRFVAGALERSFAGQRLVDVTYARPGVRDTAAIAGLSAEDRALIDERYTLDQQEKRGAWFLPQEVTLKVGLCNLPHLCAIQPRFAMNAGRDEVAKVDVRTCPDALVLWTVLIPLFEDLFAPLELRTRTGKVPSAAEQPGAWARIEEVYADLGLNVDLFEIRYGGRWSQLDIGEQMAAKLALVESLAAQVSAETARRWRARAVKALTAAYHVKAKKGPPLARAVLTKANQTLLSAAFAGDWLDFLDYLGEAPNVDERITTELPEPASSVAGRTAGEPSAAPAVEERLAVMRRWWREFDRLHAQQKPGMAPLWGLVDKGGDFFDDERGPSPQLRRRLLPADLAGVVDRLWSGVTLARWPDRVVSEFHPHQQMAAAFGPALEFWHGVGLTVWFVCEGPYSRTTLDGLEQYYDRQIGALDEIGFPVDRSLFTELRRAERRLGPEQGIVADESFDEEEGVVVGLRLTVGTRRDGFEMLRDIVTQHRRSWAAQHLDGYLQSRAENELRAAAREYHRRSAGRGKPPTLKQYASFATGAANHWFGGDLAALSGAIGVDIPVRPQRVDLLDGDPAAFVRTVYAALGGGPALPPDASWRDRDAFTRQWELRRLATEALRYVQLSEALGRAPSPSEFGAARLQWDAVGGPDAGWVRYEDAVREAATGPPSS